MIGNFGKAIIFRVSDKEVLTFSDMKRTVSGNWTTHNAIQQKGFSEFLGPDLDRITLRIQLCADLGVKPRQLLEKMEQYVKTGQVEYLVIGEKAVGSGKYKITNMSENWDTVFADGKLYSASLDLTFEEY